MITVFVIALFLLGFTLKDVIAPKFIAKRNEEIDKKNHQERVASKDPKWAEHFKSYGNTYSKFYTSEYANMLENFLFSFGYITIATGLIAVVLIFVNDLPDSFKSHLKNNPQAHVWGLFRFSTIDFLTKRLIIYQL